MKRLYLVLAYLLVSPLAFAQDSGVPPTPQSAAGTTGDGWLIAWLAIAFVVVAVGVYLFIKRGGRVKM